ncbi:glutamate racemase [Terrihabitans soli]|uniref:glutamate racemase n=1 Tax=Terrihabitans soli TaxID=708113 RepID=UPI003B82D8EB
MKFDLLAGTAAPNASAPRDRVPRILVFDSGLGGLTVHGEIARITPSAELIYVADTEVFPYGQLAEDVLIARVRAVIAEAVKLTEPDIAVIACNTASTLVLPVLRSAFDIPFVGTVPAIKPACEQSLSKRISVLATPGTVMRDYTRELVAVHAQSCDVTLVGSTRLAGFAQDELFGAPASDADLIEELRPAFVEKGGARTDIVVLACTHYPLILHRLVALAPWPVTFIDSAPAIARRTAQLLGDVKEGPQLPARAFFTGSEAAPPPLRAALGTYGLSDIQTLKVSGG